MFRLAMRPLYLLALAALPLFAADDGLELFEKEIRPTLATRCYACHSEKSNVAQGGLYVDSKEGLLRGGKSGAPAIVPGKPEESLLIKAIQHTHQDLKMPPGKPLAPERIEAFVAWVKMGAPDPRTGNAKAVAETPAYDWEKEKKHWAYQPLPHLTPPAIPDPAWSKTEIDRFLKAKLDEKGLKPLGRATKSDLLRRVTYDLTGLPPSPEDMRAFLADSSPIAFETVVDRLLASPQYGEQWGRRWLDLVRYADTAGDASDFPVPEMYRYRNYVIRSFNADKPYDQFIREQLAGDLLTPKDDEDRREKIIATGYIAASRRFGQSMGEHYLTIDDTVDNFGKAVLGLTTGCARCHDHKFDPIPTKDYYGLYGLFQSTKYAHAGMEHHQYLENFTALDRQDSEKLKKAQTQMVESYRVVKKGLGPNPEEADAATQLAFYKASTELTKLRQNFPQVPMAFAVSDGPPQNVRVMIKGDPKTLGPEAPRGFLQILGGQRVPADYQGSGRDLLAQWVTDAQNPLTARVLVNRVWLGHFGRGIVNTPSDFGARGDRPTHPELLDWLASTFQQDGWSLKKLHRRILLTRAYQTSSGYDEATAVKDSKNEYYWRFDRRRLSAEELRDKLLLASGTLDPTMGGPHPFPPRGSYTFTQHNPFVADLAAYDTNRRSVYLVQQRFRRNPYLELFDGPDPNNTTPSRSQDASALQSLYFLNDEFVQRQADAIAVRVALAETLPARRIQQAYQLLFQRPASLTEVQEATRFLADYNSTLRSTERPADQKPRLALTGLMRALLSTNEFFYID